MKTAPAQVPIRSWLTSPLRSPSVLFRSHPGQAPPHLGTTGATCTINLTGVTNAQRLGVTLSNVIAGTHSGDITIPMGVLLGDTTASGTVNAGDVSQTKAQSGQTVGAGNFRTDVTINGTINASDVSLVKSNSGNALPP